MDLFFSVINKELNVIDKPEQGARELYMEVCGSFFNNHSALYPLDDLPEIGDGICRGRRIGQWRYEMGGISALARDTVRAVWTGGEPAVLNPEVRRPHAVTADQDNGQQQEQGT